MLFLLSLLLQAQAIYPTENVSSTWPVNYYGVDVSQPYGVAAFQCLVRENLLFAVIRCYQSVGRPDPNCASSVANAHAAGMKVLTNPNHADCVQVVDGYFFPCPTCGPAANQVNQMLSYFNANRVNIKTMWLDIEGTQYWTGNTNNNRAWYQSLVQACHAAGLNIGIYSSYYQWEGIFGSAGYVYGNNLPLW